MPTFTPLRKKSYDLAADVAFTGGVLAAMSIFCIAETLNASYLAYSRIREQLSRGIHFPPQGQVKTQRVILDNSPLEIEEIDGTAVLVKRAKGERTLLGRVANTGSVYVAGKSYTSYDPDFPAIRSILPGRMRTFVDYIPSHA